VWLSWDSSSIYDNPRRLSQGNESRLTKARRLAWNVCSRLKLGFRRLAGRAIRRSSRGNMRRECETIRRRSKRERHISYSSLTWVRSPGGSPAPLCSPSRRHRYRRQIVRLALGLASRMRGAMRGACETAIGSIAKPALWAPQAPQCFPTPPQAPSSQTRRHSFCRRHRRNAPWEHHATLRRSPRLGTR